MTITRYILSCEGDGCDFGPEETANPHGAWVTYEDHVAALKAAEADAARLREALDACAADAEPYHTMQVTLSGDPPTAYTDTLTKRIAVKPEKWSALLAARGAP